MLRLTFTFLILLSFSVVEAQKNTVLSINLVRSNNNVRYQDVFENGTNTANIYVPAQNDKLGFSFRKENKRGIFLETTLGVAFSGYESIYLNEDGIWIEHNQHEVKHKELHLRIEVGKLWKLALLKNLQYGISGSLDPRIRDNKFTAQNDDVYDFSFQSRELSLHVIPQIIYNINDRFLAQIKLPFQLANYASVKGLNQNPAISENEMEVRKDFSDAITGKLSYTIGVGYYLSHDGRQK